MTTLREAIARRIAARKTGVACRTGIGLPDDIWGQALPDADDALAAIEAAGYRLTRVVRKERQPLVIDDSDYEERHKHDEERDE